MNLAVVNEAVTEMNGVEHQFTEEEKNFVVQFAFRSGSKEDTISLIEALAHSADKAESDEIRYISSATSRFSTCSTHAGFISYLDLYVTIISSDSALSAECANASIREIVSSLLPLLNANWTTKFFSSSVN